MFLISIENEKRLRKINRRVKERITYTNFVITIEEEVFFRLRRQREWLAILVVEADI